MTIEKLSECKNASRFGTCTECGVSESETHNLRRLKFNGVSVCLCQDCLSKTQKALNNVTLVNLVDDCGNSTYCDATKLKEVIESEE